MPWMSRPKRIVKKNNERSAEMNEEEMAKAEARSILMAGIEEGKDPFTLLDEIASEWDGDPVDLF